MRRWVRLTALAASALLLLLAAAAAWLMRDPEPYFVGRKGSIAALEEKEPRLKTGYAERLVTLHSTTGLNVQLAVKEPHPAYAPGDPLRPLIVILGGRETGRKGLRFVGETRGAVVAILSYPYEGPQKPRGFDIVCAIPDIRRAFMDTPPAVMLALDWLIELPGIDRSRVELCGVSLGSPFACVIGALEPRFTRVWSVHGAGSPFALLEHQMREKVPWWPVRTLAAGAAYVGVNGPYMAPERWVERIAPRPFVMLNAEEDERLPREAVESLWCAAQEPRELHWLPGRHVGPNRPEVVQQLIDVVLTRVTGPAVLTAAH